jgi:hypothetical protein
MRSVSPGTELIERYLLARGRRYFRGHHDGEYFFIVTVGHERLHVHLEISPADRDTLTLRITPAYFFPATDRARLLQFADKWNRPDRRAIAIVYESCDQTRVGVAVQASYSLAPNVAFGEFGEFGEFGDMADDTIRSAVQLFTAMTPAAEPRPARPLGTWLRDAG